MRHALFLAATTFAGPPIVLLVVLVAWHAAAPGPALIASIALLAGGLIVGSVWSHDIAALHAAIRRADDGGGPSLAVAAHGRTTVLPPMDRLARAIDRIARANALRAAQFGRQRRIDAAIVEALPDPLILLAADRTVRRANAAARAAFGAEVPAVLRNPALRTAIDRALAGGLVDLADVSVAAPVLREIQATAIPLDADESDQRLVAVLLSDRSRDRAVDRIRADFVANASHELRTPLASLIGFIDTLRGPAAADPPAQQRFLAIMSEQAARMNRLIDDLLNLSRIEIEEHHPPSASVDLNPLLARVSAGFEPRLGARGLSLAVETGPSPCVVTADADQIAQVVQNLLDNACKYGAEGGRILISVRRPDGGGRWPSRAGVVIAVADQGPGIPRHHLPRLTERFYRIDASRSRAVGGIGLGLAIVKHIVNRHRGQLLIESEEGVGTTVSVWLPLAVGAAPPAPMHERPE